MDYKRRTDIFLKIIIPAVIAFVAIAATNGPLSLIALPLIIAISIFVSLYGQLSAKQENRRTEFDALGKALKYIFDGITEQKQTLTKSMDDAVNKLASSSASISAALVKIRKRMELGNELHSAIAAEKSHLDDGLGETLMSIGIEYGKTGNITNSLKNEYQKMERKKKIFRERAFGASQKFLVINMVVGTILPSLLIFGFIGYSILSYSESQFLIFSVILLSALPGASGVIRMRLNEQT